MSSALRCKGTTKAGVNCKNPTRFFDQLCHLHRPETTGPVRFSLAPSLVVPSDDEPMEGDPILPAELMYLIALNSPSIAMYRKWRLVSRNCHLSRTDTLALIDRLTVVKTTVEFFFCPTFVGKVRLNKGPNERLWREKIVTECPRVGGKLFGTKRKYMATSVSPTRVTQFDRQSKVLTYSVEYLNNKKHGLELLYYHHNEKFPQYNGVCKQASWYDHCKRQGLFLALHQYRSWPIIACCPSLVIDEETSTCYIEKQQVIKATFSNGKAETVSVWEITTVPTMIHLDQLIDRDPNQQIDLTPYARCIKTCQFRDNVRCGIWTEVPHTGVPFSAKYKKGVQKWRREGIKKQ
jgi:hypothetical protein